MNLEQLKFDIDTYEEIEIRNVERLKRKEDDAWVDSPSIKITFVSTNCPTYVSLYHIRYKVRNFIPDIMQCHKCQCLGHSTKSCTARYPRCLYCSGPHNKEQCKTQTRTCANCREPHYANSNSCTYIQDARTVEKIKAKQNIDYPTARKEMIKQKNDRPQANAFPPLRPRQPASNQMKAQDNNYEKNLMNYAGAAQTQRRSQPFSNSENRTNNRDEPILVNKSVQTDNVREVKECLCTSDGFFTKLKQLIIELLGTDINKDNQPVLHKLAESAIKKSFGIDLQKQEKHTTTRDTEINPTEDNHQTEKRQNESTKRKATTEEQIQKSTTQETLSAENSGGEESDGEIWQTVEKRVVKINMNQRKKDTDTGCSMNTRGRNKKQKQ